MVTGKGLITCLAMQTSLFVNRCISPDNIHYTDVYLQEIYKCIFTGNIQMHFYTEVYSTENIPCNSSGLNTGLAVNLQDGHLSKAIKISRENVVKLMIKSHIGKILASKH